MTGQGERFVIDVVGSAEEQDRGRRDVERIQMRDALLGMAFGVQQCL